MAIWSLLIHGPEGTLLEWPYSTTIVPLYGTLMAIFFKEWCYFNGRRSTKTVLDWPGTGKTKLEWSSSIEKYNSTLVANFCNFGGHTAIQITWPRMDVTRVAIWPPAFHDPFIEIL